MAGPLDTSFRRSVRGGVEQQEFSDLSSFLNSVVLSTSNDRWYFSLSSSGEFSVKDTRLAIDDLVLPSHSEPTRWVKLIPIKINVFMWRARRGCLPTRYNLVQKGVILESTSCPVCFSDEEDVHHLLFRCSLSQEVLHRVCRWWEIDFQLWRSFSEWDAWFSSIRLPGSVKEHIRTPKHFGEDALPRPPGAQRIAKSQRSSNSTASSGSNPLMYQEMMKEQYELPTRNRSILEKMRCLGHPGHNELLRVNVPQTRLLVIELEKNERMRLYHSQRIAEDMKVLQIDTRGMDSVDAAIINAQKARVRALYPPPN
ncbi:RNA-directed DNA polymerase, eukaryota [Tanacetum coccineum]